jgi:hypothetical protein
VVFETKPSLARSAGYSGKAWEQVAGFPVVRLVTSGLAISST